MLRPPRTMAKARREILRFTNVVPDARGSESRKPSNLIYDVDEVPPVWLRCVLALQHVLVISVGWIFVVVMVSGFGGTAAQAQSVMRVSMLASGVATILLHSQSRNRLASG